MKQDLNRVRKIRGKKARQDAKRREREGERWRERKEERSWDGRKAVKKRKGTRDAAVRGVEEEMRCGFFDTPHQERREISSASGG